ncbi:probable LRR receptor-like serine/threonine-protein kinase At4g36180 [Gastrolobium bilobum]|uniref:probable LRR receptor-like serine/threonine-protein kinase At4g36180 n=1 Tax=Gastrolobium bilobum TaxID=150636 RepID=UPI002AB2C724|nr:probable LRR receptor-like serine/threonine-protein kinase At4g36180 [Gastrolobium bilobum]
MGSLSFSLFVTIAAASGLLFGAESKTYWGDAEVLKELKNGLDPRSVTPGSCVSSWDFTVDPCDNLLGEKFTCGFRCDVVVSGLSRVTELSLDQAGYSGSLPFTLNLPYLETLDVSNNNFSGNIPESLSNLTRLRRLGLSTNSFSGEIPDSVGSLSNLEELYLDNNNLQGTIPASFNGLVSLKRLELQSNKLNGHLPELGSLINLNYLDLSNNAITGSLPTSLPVSLVQISTRNNNLSGALTSESFKNLMYLEVVDFSSNQFSDSVPSILFELPSLQQLTLSFNQFSWIEVPSYTQSELIAVDLSNNQLQGVLPTFLALMPKLSSLSLENNEFTGLIPIHYALKTVFPEIGISPFGRLLLGGNYLFGGIPRPLLVLKPDSANVSLVDNCLYRCPHIFFFCQGGQQKSLAECKGFSPLIP